MYDEIPASPTPNGPSDDPSDEPSANPEPASSRSGRESDRGDADRDGSDRADADRDGSDRAESDCPRGGVGPPAETGRDRSERDRIESDAADDECDPESVEYRIERLRLIRIVVTLAVVVVRLIRSL